MNDPKQIHKVFSQRLSADLIARFQKKYLQTFDEQISPEFAEAELLGLAELVRIVLPAAKAVKDGRYYE